MWYSRISWLPAAVNCPIPRRCFLCVKDSHCTYLFMWGQFYRISDCVLEHQLLVSTEVCSTHLYLVWLLLLYFRFVNSSEALQLIGSQVTSFLFYFSVFAVYFRQMIFSCTDSQACCWRQFGCCLQKHCKTNALRMIYDKKMPFNFYCYYWRKTNCLEGGNDSMQLI